MKKRTIDLFVLGAVVLTLALFGCSGGNTADTVATGTVIDGAVLYSSDCSGCHGPLATSGKRGASVSQIQNAITQNWGGMGAFAGFNTDQLQAIVTALAVPPAITDGNPAAALDGAALYADKCSSCHGQLAQSGKGGALASAIQAAIANNAGGMGRFSNLTADQIQAIADALARVQAPTPASPSGDSNSVDGAALYAAKCQGCHGSLAASAKAGRTATQIQAAIANSATGMGYLSTLTQTEIDAIASALAVAPTPAPTDGAALYTTYCASCHGPLATSRKSGATADQIQTGISNDLGGMRSLSSLSTTELQAIATALSTGTPPTTPAPPPACGSCHAIPPATGQHSYHVTSQHLTCGTCHGTGYSSTAVNTATHQNGTVNIAGTIGWNATTRSCSNSCHGSRSWGGTAPAPAPAPTDGAALYTQYCEGCHGSLAASSKAGSTATQIQAAIANSATGMGYLSTLTQTEIDAIASALAVAPTPAPTDGAALYTTYCASCHGPLATSYKSGATVAQIQTGISNDLGGMGSLSILSTTELQAIATALSTGTPPTTPAPTPACGSCHAIPPATGQHSKHKSRSCSTCHGTGYSSTTVNTATHQNGTVNIVGTIGWNPTTRSCSNSCHGTKRW